MRCPYCQSTAARRELHLHLAETHASELKTSADEAQGSFFYDLACPLCAQTMRRQIKPRWKDPAFLEEFGREIRLVAFDLLLYHVESDHPDLLGGPDVQGG